jgi:membrane protein implicated in regulation of membrane protease activity
MTHHDWPVRAGVVAAVGFLALDAVLLAWAGWWTHRFALVLWGALLACLTAVPLLLWRRYRRRMDEVRAARHAMVQEVHHLQMALRERQR